MKSKEKESNNQEFIKKMEEINDVYRIFNIKQTPVNQNTDFRQPSLLKYDGLKFFSSTTSQSN